MWRWQVRGACNDIGTDIWFPEKGKSSNSETIKLLLSVCAACPVRDECLAAALELEGDCGKAMRHGIWGGTLPNERHRMVKGPRRPRVISEDNLCPRGLHAMTEDNIYVHPNTEYRECRGCRADRRRVYEERRKAG